jgi:hypothetical protein
MANAKHSPAPWKNLCDANGNLVICQADTATAPEWNETYQANRALVDSAPELLDALKALSEEMQRVCDAFGVRNREVDKAHAAIAKATRSDNGGHHGL